jgi:hypothetical protein
MSQRSGVDAVYKTPGWIRENLGVSESRLLHLVVHGLVKSKKSMIKGATYHTGDLQALLGERSGEATYSPRPADRPRPSRAKTKA